MNTFEFISHLRSRDIKLTVDGDQLRLKAPPGALTPTLRNELADRKSELIAFLKEADQVTRARQTSIPRVSRERPLPLSPNQHRLWTLTQLAPDSPAYNMQLAVRLNGPLKAKALEQSLNDLVERHEILRTTFPAVDDLPVQKIAPSRSIDLAVETIPAASEEEQKDHIDRIISREANIPYNLEEGPLLRLKLIRLSGTEHVLLIGMHHIISDGWSYGIFERELSALYTAHLAGRQPDLPELPIQYADYAVWQRDWQQGSLYQDQAAYWQQQLSGKVETLILPGDLGRKARYSHRADMIAFSVPELLVTKIRELSRQEQVTVYITLLSAFYLLLHRFSGQEDLVVCSPVAGRDLDEVKPLIGYFNNIVPVRAALSGNPTFREIIDRVRQVSLEAQDHAGVPFQEIAGLANLAQTNLSRALFWLQAQPGKTLRLPHIRLKQLPIFNETAHFDLTIQMAEEEGRLDGWVLYKPDQVDPDIASQLAGHFISVLAAVADNPGQPLSALPNLSSLQPQAGRAKMRLLTDRETFVPPRDTIELTLAGIWERLLEFQPRSISITDNFFDLGGHSLIAVRMLAEIEQVFNRDISIRTLLENPTIERLAQLIRMNGRRQQADSPLVALQREGRQPPFFLVHALGGNPMLYANMVRHLGPDQPFYVLQSPAFDEQGEAVPAVGALAGQYIESLRQIQPEGPYYLGGMCEAAVVAHEMAQQLLAQDQQVAMLAIFDPPLMEHLGYRGKVINLISRFEEELGRVEGPFVNHCFNYQP